jgi:hypothetical protein
VLIVILVLFGLGFAAIVGTGWFVARHGAGYALGKIIAASDPNMEVLRTDTGAGTITLRDRRNGKVVTMSMDDAKHGRFRISADDGNGKTALFELGGSVRAPSWVPMYPGSTPKAVFSASGDTGGDAGEAGNFTFTTSDPAGKVISFYEQQVKAGGMEVFRMDQAENAHTLVASESSQQRSLTIIAAAGSGGTTVNVTYGRKR